MNGILYFIIALFIAFCIKLLCVHILTSIVDNKKLLVHLKEFLASAEACFVFLETLMVVKHFSSRITILFQTITLHYLKTFFPSSEYTNPLNLIEDVIEKKLSLQRAASITFVQLLAGFFVRELLMVVWSKGISPYHIGKITRECRTNLNEFVPACFSEILLNFLMFWCSKKIVASRLKGCQYLKMFFAYFLLDTGCFFRGPYTNPVIATVRKWGCPGETRLQHLLVYWISPVLGTTAAILLYHKLFKEKKNVVEC